MAGEILRFSRRVPDAACNLAFIEIPPIEPGSDLSIVDTGLYVPENRDKVWLESLGADVLGTFGASVSTTGYLFFVTYNPAVTGAPITTGVATYSVGRSPTTGTSPSGYVIDNFTTQIRVLPPVENTLSLWQPRIQDGLVVRKYVLQPGDQSWLANLFDPGDELVLYHTVPEMRYIPYLAEGADGTSYLDRRVLDVSGAVAAVLDDHNVQLPTGDLVEILAVWVNGQAIVTSASGRLFAENEVQPAQLPPRGAFSDWDPLAGTLTLARSLRDTDEVRVNYRYHEFLLSYQGYTDEGGTNHNLALEPIPNHTYDGGKPTSELLHIPIYIYLLPTAAYRIRAADGTVEQERRLYSGLCWTQQFLRWERTAASVAVGEAPRASVQRRSTFGFDYFDGAEFVDRIPVDTLSTPASAGSGLAYLPCALILAKIYVTPNAQIGNVQVIDTRVRGGGIPEEESLTDPRLPGATIQEIGVYWDNSGWDGQPVPLAGVLVVELPRSLLTGENGFARFTSPEIEAMVRQHVAAGIRVVVKYV